MKEFLIYELNKDLLLYNTNYQHVLIFHPVIYKLEHNGGLMSSQAKLNYKGHYMYPNMCNCTKYSKVKMENIYFPIFTWTYAVYNCTCIHKLVAIVRSIMESNLNYWDEIIVINKFVSDVIQLYPMSQYGFNCECKL